MTNKKLNRIFAVALIGFFAINLMCCAPSMARDPGISDDIEVIEARFLAAFSDVSVYDSSELTGEILVARDGMVIERVIGVVENGNGDGRVLNCEDSEFNYISYRECNIRYSVGDIILTYLIYDPLGNGEDDIIDRYDFNLHK